MTITTNSHVRQFKYGYEVPKKVLSDQFDYLDSDESYDGFIHYRGIWYHTSEFMVFSSDWRAATAHGYHGYHSDSYFSAILIKISDDCETYQIATAIS